MRGQAEKTRGILIGAELDDAVCFERELHETWELAQAAGIFILKAISQALAHPNAATLFGSGKIEEICSERKRLEEVVDGVYVMEFVIFHGERLVYSIEDDPNGNAKIVESEVLKKKNFNHKNLNRFEMLNSMLVKQEMRDDRSLLEDLDIYINTVHLYEENLNIL